MVFKDLLILLGSICRWSLLGGETGENPFRASGPALFFDGESATEKKTNIRDEFTCVLDKIAIL